MNKQYYNPRRSVADLIRAAYIKQPKISIRPVCPGSVKDMVATLTARGLGDCLMLTDLPFAATAEGKVANIWASSKYFLDVMQFHPSYSFTSADCGLLNPFLVDILRLREVFDLGNGHQLQQLRRAWGFQVPLRPKPALNRIAENQLGRVILHFEPSAHNAAWQRKHWHPHMRELYDTSKKELEQFIKRHPELEFIEVGTVSSEIRGAEHVQTSSTAELIKVIQSGTWFIGIMSGPLHIAVASDLRCIVVVNFPRANQIVLPVLRRAGNPEEEWYYPQNVHLHQESESPLVPRFNRDSLEAAFNGDVYPFQEDTWLGLINEPL